MATVVEDLKYQWQSRLQSDFPDQPTEHCDSIVAWLLGDTSPDSDQAATPQQQRVQQQAIDYRYRILCKRYLNVPQSRAYRQLLNRLSSVFVVRNKVRTWISLSRDRYRSVTDVLQEVIQEMIRSDRHMQEQIEQIGHCTTDSRLRNALMLTSIEEYCLRPIRNQPLITYRFVNYLRRSQRGGMTQVPTQDIIRLVSEERVFDDGDNPVSLLDGEAIAHYEDDQFWQEQQALRHSVKQEFITYLKETLGDEAVQWLELYLQGHTQDMIAQQMELPVNRVYRLREKVSYHAVKVFGTKRRSELVTIWLGTSLKEHNFGLTSEQWQQFWQGITPTQQHMITELKSGNAFDDYAKTHGLSTTQVLSEWSKLYLLAQELRTA
ncbi:MAG: HetZ-related protein 2 [Cyanobacteria bacterium P01_A01_bin.135]